MMVEMQCRMCAVQFYLNVTGDVLGVVGCGRDVEWCADMVVMRCGIMVWYMWQCGCVVMHRR